VFETPVVTAAPKSQQQQNPQRSSLRTQRTLADTDYLLAQHLQKMENQAETHRHPRARNKRSRARGSLADTGAAPHSGGNIASGSGDGGSSSNARRKRKRTQHFSTLDNVGGRVAGVLDAESGSDDDDGTNGGMEDDIDDDGSGSGTRSLVAVTPTGKRRRRHGHRHEGDSTDWTANYVIAIPKSELLKAFTVHHISDHAVLDQVTFYNCHWGGFTHAAIEDDQSSWQPESLLLKHGKASLAA
jgi:hypothetical protein